MNDTLGLARVLCDDMTAHVRDAPTFPLLLDQAVVRMEFSRALGEEHDARRALDSALELLREGGATGPWLYRGAAQLGWTALRVARAEGTEPAGLSVVDDVVLRWIAAYPAEAEVDLPMGLLGLGVYALSHPDRGFRDKATSGVLDVIEERAERDDEGLFLRLGDSAARRADGSARCRVLGAAHGTAGLVSYLASATSVPACAPRARALLHDAARWSRARRGRHAHAIFPHRVETADRPARATWCSGDPGIGVALSAAASVTGDPRDAELARTVFRSVTTRPEEDCGITDACLCHGAAGLIWFGRRAVDEGVATGAASTRRWIDWTRRRRIEGPLTYFGPTGMTRDASFLEGDAGVALALLYAATGGRPSWEHLLLAAPVTSET